METVIKGFDAEPANQPFLVFDFPALWRAPECPKVKN